MPDVASVTGAIATNTRGWRVKRGWSQETLAARSGLSKGMLLQVEQGRTNPSIATLCRIAEALGVALATLVEPSEQTVLRTVPPAQVPVLWHGPAGGTGRLLLGTDPPVHVELWDWRLAPGECYVGDPHPADSRELLGVLEGTLEVDVDGDRRCVETGGAALFRADRPHAYACAGDVACRFTMSVLMAGAGEPEPLAARTSPALRLGLLPDAYAVSRLPADAPWPVEPAPPAPGAAETAVHSVTRTDKEVSVVSTEASAPAGARTEPGWRAFEVAGPLAFSMTGVLASLTTPLAEAGISLFAHSTFDTDYVLVRAGDVARATAALVAHGHEIEG